jgi:rubrerythrin
MNAKDSQIETIDMLTKHELAVSRFYKAYAEKFLDHKDFWEELAAEETEHAECIRELRSKMEDGHIYFNEGRFQTVAIARSLRYVEELLDKIPQPDFSLINALSAAVHIEDAMIENKYFELFEGDSAALREVMRLLSDATNNHRNRVRQTLAKNKK